MGALTLGRGQDDGVDVGPLIDAEGRRVGQPAGHRRRRTTARASSAAARPPTGRATSTSRPCCVDVPADAADQRARRSSGRSPRSPPSPPRTRRSARANATEYGLSSYVYTRDLARTLRLAEALEFGMVGVNTGLVSNPAAPFGGVKRAASAARAASRASRSTSRRPTSRCRSAEPVGCPAAIGDGRLWTCGPTWSSQYAEFADVRDGDSPCFEEWARGVAADPEVLAWLETLPELKRQPNLVFAAARWHGVPAPGPYAALREALLGDDGPIRATILSGRPRPTRSAGWPP